MVNFNEIATKWQGRWENAKIFEVKEDSKKKKYYVLEMYPYPSGSGLHMGHARNYCIGDSFARYKRMNGFNVLYPMGYDSFGLPAENAAIQAKSHPKIFTEEAVKNFIKQQKSLGLSYDWSRIIMSHDPEYYKRDQWIYIKMHDKGLAYKKKAAVNWCPKCDTVLANEQVHDGKCWRHSDIEVEPKELNQWFFKITDYAEELLNDIEKLTCWSEDVKIMQRNWIGKSYGVTLKFAVVDENGKKIDEIETYTTRVDTVYGITYLVLAVEHPKVIEWTRGTKIEKKVKEFIEKVKKESIIERTAEGKEKNGIFLGKWFTNPFTNEKCPLWAADYALYDYGTGAVMAVPTHDQRDFEFAKKYKLPLRVVISPEDWELKVEKMSRAYIDDGIMVNSSDFNGMSNRDAMEDIADFAEKKGFGKRTVNYKLKDWLISRQRFWGCPIPVVYCDKCGVIPVPEKNLPVKLPEDFKFKIGKGNPLEHCKEFVDITCPKCNGKAKRETDTMDTFVDSSWYFLRYCDARNNKAIFDKKKADYWMPVDMYIGGKEHATMHLIYFRFFTKFLRDIGLVSIDESAPRLFNQGMLHKNGVVMSKSKGNVVIPEEIAEKYGIDTARLFLLFVASPDKDMEWSDEGIEGSFRFLNKFYELISEKKKIEKIDEKEASKLNRLIKEVSYYFEEMMFSKAIISFMQFTNWLNSKEFISKESAEKLVLVMSPFTPHICEELWEKLGHKDFCSLAKWPACDESKIDNRLEALEEVVNKTISDINSVLKLIKADKPKKIKLIVSPKWKYLFIDVMKKELEKTRDIKDLIAACIKDKELKKYGNEISKLIPALVKDPSKIPLEVLNQDLEFSNLKESSKLIGKEFSCEVIVEKAEESKEEKGKQAMPGKPGILVE